MTIEALLADIDRWLRQHAPRTREALRAPASDSEIGSVERTTGIEITDDIRTLLSWHNGSAALGPSFKLVPEFDFMTVAEAVSYWSMKQSLQATRERVLPDDQTWWHRQWLPIGTDRCGSLLVCDHRDGRGYGQVFIVDKVDGALPFHTWPNITAVLEEMRNALVVNSSFTGCQAVVTADGGLRWTDTTTHKRQPRLARQPASGRARPGPQLPE
jgi:cell wall assembly regulator SMI1